MAFRLRDAWSTLTQEGPAGLWHLLKQRLGAYWSFRSWVRKLPDETPIDEIIEVVVDRSHGPDQPVFAWQKKAEIRALLNRLEELRPRRVLEIGTAAGGTLLLLSRVAAPDAVLISIDLPEGHFGGGYNLLRVFLYRSFARAQQRIVPLRRDSHAASTRNRLGRLLDGEPLDFLFIDGDHSAEGVSRDFADYAPFVRPGGLIALHDIRADERNWSGAVHRVWPQLAARFRAEELVDETGPSGYGIGLLEWPGAGKS